MSRVRARGARCFFGTRSLVAGGWVRGLWLSAFGGGGWRWGVGGYGYDIGGRGGGVGLGFVVTLGIAE